MAVRTLSVSVPSNRLDSKGRRTHVDGWNEYIKAAHRGRMVGNALEQENVANVADHAALASQTVSVSPEMRCETVQAMGTGLTIPPVNANANSFGKLPLASIMALASQ